MKNLIVALFVTLASIVNAQELEFEGYHSRTQGDKKFTKEVSYLKWDVKKEQIVFLSELGVKVLYNIKHIESVDESTYVGIYFVSTCGQLISLYYKGEDEENETIQCLITIGLKTYSGNIVKFE